MHYDKRSLATFVNGGNMTLHFLSAVCVASKAYKQRTCVHVHDVRRAVLQQKAQLAKRVSKRNFGANFALDCIKFRHYWLRNATDISSYNFFFASWTLSYSNALASVVISLRQGVCERDAGSGNIFETVNFIPVPWSRQGEWDGQGM
jgi:hypothetical protein